MIAKGRGEGSLRQESFLQWLPVVGDVGGLQKSDLMEARDAALDTEVVENGKG